VTKVPDGDTVVVRGVGKVRLLGIESADEPAFHLGPSAQPPRSHQDPSGKSAPPAVSGRLDLSRNRASRDFLRTLALGKTVRIEYDPLARSTKERAAYVFLADGTLLNAAMLKAGRARLDASRKFDREAEFRLLEAEAIDRGVGIWIR
jgi:endonuclease YncB( thermonuclease family)